MSTDFGPGMMGDPVPCGKCCRMGCDGKCGPSHTTRYNEFQLMSYDELLSECLRLDARIADLERCVVCGGDGPIELGQERWYWNDDANQKESFIVESYTALLLGDTYLNPDTICIEPDRTYSSPDQVPEGGK